MRSLRFAFLEEMAPLVHSFLSICLLPRPSLGKAARIFMPGALSRPDCALVCFYVLFVFDRVGHRIIGSMLRVRSSVRGTTVFCFSRCR